MRVREAWDSTLDYSAIASGNARKIAFGLAAIGWFFRSPNATFPVWVLGALSLIALFFFLDLLQYVLAYERRRRWIEREEEKLLPLAKGEDLDDQIISWTQGLDWPTRRLWWSKMIVLVIASGCLVAEFAVRAFSDEGIPDATQSIESLFGR